MTSSLFLRFTNENEKAARLLETVGAINADRPSSNVFAVDPAQFKEVPSAPFAYWLSSRLRQKFRDLPPFEQDGRETHHGLSTTDDFRFVRLWWEVCFSKRLDCELQEDSLAEFQRRCRERTSEGKRWVPFVKGGVYSPFYAPIATVIDWENDGAELKQFLDEKIGAPGQWSRWINSVLHYFRPGITWPLRGIRLSTQSVPYGTIFSVGGKVAVADTIDETLMLLGVTNSKVFDYLTGTFAGKVGGVQYEVGLIAKVPVPANSEDSDLRSAVMRGFGAQARLASFVETSHMFFKPSILACDGKSLRGRCSDVRRAIVRLNNTISDSLSQIDDLAYRLYDVNTPEIETIDRSVSGRLRTDDEAESAASDENLVFDLMSYAVGACFGRWDIRCALGDLSPPKIAGPFVPLAVCSPAMLKGEDGLPLDEAKSAYPMQCDIDGILVDDPSHAHDLVRRSVEVLDLLWNGKAEVVESEVVEILGFKSLRDFFQKTGRGGFWEDHIRRYSKSRRKAPIYWLLQSSKKNYALWLYYHRLDKDMLFKALLNYVEPKIQREENRLGELRSQKSSAADSVKDAKKLDREMEKQEDLLVELRDFEEKLRKVADLHLVPDLNDGVVLNIAPLHELVPWKEAKKYWDQLMDGKYEWSSIGKQLREKGLVK